MRVHRYMRSRSMICCSNSARMALAWRSVPLPGVDTTRSSTRG